MYLGSTPTYLLIETVVKPERGKMKNIVALKNIVTLK